MKPKNMPRVTKKRKISKIKNIKPTLINQEPKSIDEHGYPVPHSEVCFQCEERFWLSFSFARKDYSFKNSMLYWTGNGNDSRFICSPCLKKILLNPDQKKEFLKTISDSKKGHLRSYLARNII